MIKEWRSRIFKPINRRLVVTCLVAFGLGVGLTLAFIALYQDKTASPVAHNKPHRGGHRSISWTKAERKLTHCKVEAVAQTHRRLVTFTLRNGGTALTYEPAFGDVVHELARVQNKCGKIKLSTS